MRIIDGRPGFAAMLRNPGRWLAVAVLFCSAGCESRTGPASVTQDALQPCFACHSEVDENRPIGPSLYGMIGRAAATREGYFYSQALRQSGLVWGEASLDAYLADPAALVPGTFMIFRVPDPAQRRSIVDRLAELP